MTPPSETPVEKSARSQTSQTFPTSKRRTFVDLALLFLVPTALFVALFWRPLTTDERFAYRDVAYYYYPLFEQIQREWESGRLPLWDASENLGQPLAGDPTASVFYPFKAVFFLSSVGALQFGTCFKLYIWAHIALAFAGAFFWARRLNVSRSGSTLAGLSYSFGGQILFQYSNVVYLVGAAWLPVALGLAVELFAATSLKRKALFALTLGIVQGTSILGGEPQIVYLSTLAIAAFALFAPPRRLFPEASTRVRFRSRAAFCVGTTLVVAGTAFLAAAVQILPSAETISLSQRAQIDSPRSLWELLTRRGATSAIESVEAADSTTVSSDSDAEDAGLFQTPTKPIAPTSVWAGLFCNDVENGAQSRSTYRFSVGPWRWFEFLFPNVGGRQFPRAGRWFSIFPEELAVWTPTLYCGVVPFLLAFSAFRLFRSRGRRPNDSSIAQIAVDADVENRSAIRESFRIGASWLVVFGLLGALGGFGVVWATRFVRALADGSVPPPTFRNGDPLGGLYWLLDLTLPKFAEFRYPGKLLTLSAAGISVLSGIGWDAVRRSPSAARRFRVAAFATIGVAVVGGVFVALRGSELFASIRTVDPLFGPFQPKSAFETVRASFAQTAVALAATLAALAFVRRPRVVAAFVLTLTAIDIYNANNWTVATAPNALFERRSPLLERVEAERNADLTADLAAEAHEPADARPHFDPSRADAPPTRVYRFPVWFPPTFQARSSDSRTLERVVWDVATLFPKYPYRQGLAAFDARGAATEARLERFQNSAPTRTGFDAEAALLDVRYLLGPQAFTSRLSPTSSNSDSETTPNSPSNAVSLKRVAAEGRRIWVARNGRPDFRDDERVEIVSFEPNRIVALTSLRDAAQVVFAEQFWPDWNAKIAPASPRLAAELADARFDADAVYRILKRYSEETEESRRAADAPVDRAFEFLRAVDVPAGKSCVVLTYRPKKFFVGAAISGATWIVFAGIVIGTLIKRRRAQRGEKS